MKSHGLKKADDYFSLLQSSSTEWSELVESVVVTETWFFRDNESFLTLLRLVQDWLLANPTGKVRLLVTQNSGGTMDMLDDTVTVLLAEPATQPGGTDNAAKPR